MRILVLGVGNILLTDEAIGVRIVEALEQRYILPDEEVPALFTNKISPHQLGLADVLSALRFTGEFPKKLTLVGVIPESLEPHIGLTPTVEAMIEPALEQVLAALRESGVEAIPREAIHD